MYHSPSLYKTTLAVRAIRKIQRKVRDAKARRGKADEPDDDCRLHRLYTTDFEARTKPPIDDAELLAVIQEVGQTRGHACRENLFADMDSFVECQLCNWRIDKP